MFLSSKQERYIKSNTLRYDQVFQCFNFYDRLFLKQCDYVCRNFNIHIYISIYSNK